MENLVLIVIVVRIDYRHISLEGGDPLPAFQMRGPVKKDAGVFGVEFVRMLKIGFRGLVHGLAFRNSRQTPPGQGKARIQIPRALKFIFGLGEFAAAKEHLTGKFVSRGRCG